MGGDVASLNFPVESAIGEEVQQLTTRYIVLRVHQVEIALQRVHNDAVGHADIADLRGIREAGADHLMSAHIDDAVGDRVLQSDLTPLTAVKIK